MKIGLPSFYRRWTLALIVCTALIGSSVHASDDGDEKIFENGVKSTVWIVNLNEKVQGSGSLIDILRGKKGLKGALVLTNYHVVGRADNVMVLFASYQKNDLVRERQFYRQRLLSRDGALRGEVLHRDKKTDLALVRIEAAPPGAKPLVLAPLGSVKTAQDVHSIGNPGTSDALWVYTPGKVRSVYHKTWKSGKKGEELMDLDAQVIETTSPINSGDSGGPLLNNKGELVGVTQGHLVGEGVNSMSLFISVDEVRTLLKKQDLLPKNAARENHEGIAKRSEPSQKPMPVPAAASDKAANETEQQENAANRLLDFANDLLKDGKVEKAKSRLEEIAKKYPKTKAATQAKTLLDKINKMK